ncbi:hypothetical protein Sta7437_3549 [Stanieria cyanosphaera PCC 7437]|uniref:O-antigen polymerase n=1 Tax=Stanieria cyanosphaera (strain ATCC 29371 / PCC 7437) TaxID=111780 RepID=K9XZF9_STAC7|nr:hypothetical protein [Stanieria cyanosphaera]AFZ37047.1 hypothetical protein Sta7437_3549 [Stanieria cyanosphaera PCC 7437]
MNLNRQEIFIASTATTAFLVSVVLVIFSSLLTSLIGAVLIVALAIAYRYPRQGLWLFLIYLPFTGTVSYSFASIYRAVGGYVTYSGDYALFHLAKDALYFPALIAIVLSSQRLKQLRNQAKPLLIALSLLLAVCLLTLLLVNLPQQLSALPKEKPLLMGIIGLKILIGYVPLLVCGYYLIRDRQDLQFLLRLQIILALICSGLGLIQYFLLVKGICLGNTHLIEPAATRATLQARCFVGGSLLYNPAKQLISLPGTFVAPWQWTWFLISSSFFTTAATVGESSLRWRIISFFSALMVLIAAIISGQTTAIILVPFIFFILLLITETQTKRLALKLGIAIFLGILIANTTGVFGTVWSSAIARWNYSPPQEFVINQFNWILQEGVKLLGNGLGKAASAARRLGEIKLIETFYPRLLYEIGWVGTLTFLVAVTVTTVFTFQAYRSIKELSLKRISICLWILILLISYNTYYYPLIIEPVAIYYWFFAGVLLKLPNIET